MNDEFGGPGWNGDETVKSCPECGHPMMRGPLQSKGRIVAWWCANCHHGIEPDAEELAREDARRVNVASEEDR